MTHGIGGSTAQQELAQLALWPDRAPAISASERAQRLARARALMAEIGVDALIVNAGANLRYFTGLPWTATERLVAMVLRRTGSPVIVCPHFELGSLEAGLAIDVQVRAWHEHENPYLLVADALHEDQAKVVALDPQAPFFAVEGLRDACAGVAFVNAAAVTDTCRMIKSDAELALMRQAMAMTLEVHRRAAAILAPGITTTQVRRFIDEAHRALGADSGSTFCAVQFAHATAYPHGVPGEQRLASG
ncbi:MAG: M24 family metallopeptidase, partial [Lysobacter sp.]